MSESEPAGLGTCAWEPEAAQPADEEMGPDLTGLVQASGPLHPGLRGRRDHLRRARLASEHWRQPG